MPTKMTDKELKARAEKKTKRHALLVKRPQCDCMQCVFARAYLRLLREKAALEADCHALAAQLSDEDHATTSGYSDGYSNGMHDGAQEERATP